MVVGQLSQIFCSISITDHGVGKDDHCILICSKLIQHMLFVAGQLWKYVITPVNPLRSENQLMGFLQVVSVLIGRDIDSRRTLSGINLLVVGHAVNVIADPPIGMMEVCGSPVSIGYSSPRCAMRMEVAF